MFGPLKSGPRPPVQHAMRHPSMPDPMAGLQAAALARALGHGSGLNLQSELG
jgi:hypothetical protein